MYRSHTTQNQSDLDFDLKVSAECSRFSINDFLLVFCGDMTQLTSFTRYNVQAFGNAMAQSLARRPPITTRWSVQVQQKPVGSS